MKEFQSRLRELRVERGISQGGLSKALGLSRNVITNYELGIREPSLDTLKAICDFFDVPADYLIGRADSY